MPDILKYTGPVDYDGRYTNVWRDIPKEPVIVACGFDDFILARNGGNKPTMWYKFDEDISSGIVPNHGTITGDATVNSLSINIPPLVCSGSPDKFAAKLQCDGLECSPEFYTAYPYDPTIDPFSVEFWTQADEARSANILLQFGGDYSGHYVSVEANSSSARVEFVIEDEFGGVAYTEYNFPSPLDPGEVIYVYAEALHDPYGGSIALYVNGELKAQSSLYAAISSSVAGPLYINSKDAIIDQLIYNDVYNLPYSEDILRTYNIGIGAEVYP